MRESVNHFIPKNKTAFDSATTKIAKKLGMSPTEVAYQLSLDPQYYTVDGIESDEYADREYGLGISDSQSYEDQKDNLQKAYGLTDEELNEIISSEVHWSNQ